MLAAMSNVLRIKCEMMKTAYKILVSLLAMFGHTSDQSRHDAFKATIKAKMKAGTSVREHVLKMINWLKEAEIHGAVINKQSQVNVILESFSPTFLQFKSNFIMNKLSYNMTQFLNELQTFESITKEKGKKVRQMLLKLTAFYFFRQE